VGVAGIRPYLLDGVALISQERDPNCERNMWCTTLNNPEHASAGAYVALSLNDQDVVDWSWRGDPGLGGTVGEPWPEQRDGEHPECKGLEDPSFPGGCMIFTEIGSPTSTLVFIDEDDLKADREVAPPTAEDILFVCDRPGLANHAVTHAGVAIGLLGASTTPSEEEASRIGSFALVCAPWSSHPYTSNWRFVTYLGEVLSHAGGTSPDTLVSKFSRSYGRLARALGVLFERRCANPSCSQTQLRPPSMQLCPPNTVLRGADFIVHGKEFAGVSALDCVSKDKNRNILKTVVPLNPNAHELYSNMFDARTLAGDPFSLEQHIGRANSIDGDDIVAVNCPPGKALGGLRVRRNSSRVIIGVEARCTTMPEVRMDRVAP